MIWSRTMNAGGGIGTRIALLLCGVGILAGCASSEASPSGSESDQVKDSQHRADRDSIFAKSSQEKIEFAKTAKTAKEIGFAACVCSSIYLHKDLNTDTPQQKKANQKLAAECANPGQAKLLELHKESRQTMVDYGMAFSPCHQGLMEESGLSMPTLSE